MHFQKGLPPRELCSDTGTLAKVGVAETDEHVKAMIKYWIQSFLLDEDFFKCAAFFDHLCRRIFSGLMYSPVSEIGLLSMQHDFWSNCQSWFFGKTRQLELPKT